MSLSQDHLSSTFRGWALKLLNRGMRKKNASLKDGWATMVGGRYTIIGVKLAYNSIRVV